MKLNKNRWVIAMIDCKSNPEIIREYYGVPTLLNIGEKALFRLCRSIEFLKWYYSENAFYECACQNKNWSRWHWLENYRTYRKTKKKLQKLYEAAGVMQRFN